MIHHPQGATLFLLLNHVAVLADSHVWNFKLHGNINLSRLEQAHAYTDIISQKENHFGVIFQRRTGGWQLRHVAIMGKRKKNPVSFHIPWQFMLNRANLHIIQEIPATSRPGYT